jgi:hypothetical protein
MENRDAVPVRPGGDDTELDAGARDRTAEITVEDDDLDPSDVHGDPRGARVARLHRGTRRGGLLRMLAACSGDRGKDRG